MTGKRNVYTIVLGASAAIASLAGLLYSISQSFSFGSVVDPFFVGLLIANNFIIWRAVKYFSDRLIDEGTNAAIPGEPRGIVETATRRMNHTGYGLAVGIAFGVLYAPAPFITEGVWESAPEMRLYLSAFLVLSNIVTGMALNALFWFVRLSTQLGDHANVRLWSSDCAIAEFIMTNGRQVAIAVAVVSVFAVTSVLFSLFRSDVVPTIAFGVWSLLVSFSAYVLPLIPLTRQLARIKDQESSRLSKLVEKEYKELLVQAENGELESEDKAAAFVIVSDILERVRGIRVFPPVGARPVETAFWVGFLTFLPTVIDWVVGLM